MSTLRFYRQLGPNAAKPLFFTGVTDGLAWYRRHESESVYPQVKRVFDCVAAGIVLCLLSPLMLLTALLIKLDSKGPVLYCQKRVGKSGKEFCFWKFRSMRTDADQLQANLDKDSDSDDLRFKMAEDPRITRVGKFIRKFSIDELPQLWNVINGDMSLVGPRPPLPREVEKYNSYHMRRLAITPGITCTWQIGGRSDICFEQQVDMDLEYIRKQSLLEDLRILFLTPWAVLSCRGAC